GRLRYPVDERRVVDFLPRALAAGHEQHVERRAVGETVIRDELRALYARDGTGLARDQDDALAVGEEPMAEHLDRPADVEQLELREEEHADRSHQSLRAAGTT